jgi:predicted dehydrogenase
LSRDRVRIGFIGAGNMGQCAHLKNYAALGDLCEVVAIAELVEPQGRAVAARYGIPNVYTSHTDLLTGEKLDGIVAAQPFDRHGILLPEILKAGVPVFTEKPLAASIEVGQKIVDAVRRSGTWHMVGYHKRSDPATMHAKAEIDRLKKTGELGRMTYVRVLMPAGDWVAGGFNDLVRVDAPRPKLDRDPPASDMDEETCKQYTAFVNYYIHQVNLMRHLLGEPYRVTYADPSGVLLAGQSEGGVACTIEMSPYRTSIDWQESALVCFERGYVKVELPAPLASNRPGHVEIYRDPGEDAAPVTSSPQLPWVHAMRQQAVNFIAAVKGERPPMTTAAEALEDLRVARAYIRLLTGA